MRKLYSNQLKVLMHLGFKAGVTSPFSQLGGQTKSVFEWYESTDPATIAALNSLGRQQFIKEMDFNIRLSVTSLST